MLCLCPFQWNIQTRWPMIKVGPPPTSVLCPLKTYLLKSLVLLLIIVFQNYLQFLDLKSDGVTFTLVVVV